jgi:hypothetical protein
MANRDKQVDRAREALQQKEQDDRLRDEREDSQRPQDAAEPPRPKRRGERQKR